ncbi:hypothetical protein ACIQVA_30955 [Streptomyces microflavus]|uniref:effector-associated constant component EACC1 n=1 Tax=Streptomyces microflavus TaxID=1919 RepID=UPI003811DED3
MSHVKEVGVEGRLAGLDGDHEAVLDARAELTADLRSVPGARLRERVSPTGGTKGVVSELVLGITGAGGLTALAQIVKVWLQRDRRRSVTLTITETRTGKVVRVEGDAVSNDVLAAALSAREEPPPGEEEPTAQA